MSGCIRIIVLISCSFTIANVSLSQDNNYNWTQKKTYGLDDEGNSILIGESKSYADELGKPLQYQFRDFANNTIFAMQPIYDSEGKAVISTLPAPINSTSFGFKSNFVTDQSGNPYGPDNFDTSSKLYNPDPVGNQVGTLGWYYSTYNTDEPYIGTTSFPYSRVWTPSGPDPRISKSAGVGDTYRMGAGHEIVSEKQLINAGELDHYYSLRGYFVSTPNPANINNAYKFISTGPEGKKSYTYVDAGGNALMTKLEDSDPIYSYAYYNDMGQLVATVAPNGINTSSVAYPSYVTTYQYDHRGLLVYIESPDENTIHYKYATDGKLRFSQNEEQISRGTNVFSYTHFDRLGRLIESGEYHGTIQFDSPDLEVLLDQTGHIWPESDVTDWTKIYYDMPQSDFPSDPNHTDQGFTYGEITATENAQTKTWYNYDEFGRIGFTIQYIKVLNKYVTLDYDYDNIGNIKRVAYQKDTPGEAFFHHYTYDDDQRLKQVYTSVDGVFDNAYLQATYYYYKHGPLKRVELAGDLQGIDYTYTAQGMLKAINHPDHNIDPGQDGVTNDFVPDVFGLTLEYYEGDYLSAGGGFSSLDILDGEVPQKYNGNIRALNYGKEELGLDHPYDDYLILSQYEGNNKDVTARKSITLKPGFDTGPGQFDANVDPLGTYQIPNEPSKMYAYAYDSREQLEKAVYDEQGTFNYNSQKNRVDNLQYDKNGNIEELLRKDEDGGTTNNFDYQYDGGTNQIDEIPGYVTYNYDELGRVIAVIYDGEEENAYLEYDAYDHVTAIYSSAAKNPEDLRLSFTYNDQGFRLMKKNHDMDLETWYIRDASGNLVSLYYRYQGQLYQGELPIYGAGRLGIAYRNTSHYKYNYELSDHLGNVRAVVSKLKFMETASMEPEVGLLEEHAFDNIPESRRQDAIFNHTPDSHVNGASYAAWLNGAQGKVVGPAKSLKVSAGDVVKMDVYANYVDPNPTNDLVSGLALSVGSAYKFAFDNETVTYISAIEDALSGPAAVTATPGNNAPKAYMQYLLFDENFNYVSSIPIEDTYEMVTDAALVTKDAFGEVISVPHEHLENEITIPQDGYLFVYLVNETVNDIDVYFDDFTVMQLGVDIVQTAEYYPMGLAFNEWGKGNDKYRFGYQGQFAEHDEETGWSNFELRMYDPVVARWLSTDPYGQFSSPYTGMGNNPGGVDSDGGWSWTTAAIGAVAGGIIGYATSDGDWKSAVGGVIAGSVLGGVSFNEVPSGFRKAGSEAGNYLVSSGRKFAINPEFLTASLNPYNYLIQKRSFNKVDLSKTNAGNELLKNLRGVFKEYTKDAHVRYTNNDIIDLNTKLTPNKGVFSGYSTSTNGYRTVLNDIRIRINVTFGKELNGKIIPWSIGNIEPEVQQWINERPVKAGTNPKIGDKLQFKLNIDQGILFEMTDYVKSGLQVRKMYQNIHRIKSFIGGL